MKLVQHALLEATQAFRAQGVFQPKRQAEDLLCDLLECDRGQLEAASDRLFSESEWQTYRSWLHRRLQGEPLAYICGKVQFYGCSLAINPSVLIPRQETELLVDRVVQSLKDQDLQGKILWDLCCGSGCIGIALKKRFPELSVVLADCSPEALTLAARNAEANGVQVTCLLGDLLTPFRGQKAHVVVCNPPYISEGEYATLEREVKDYEPRAALVGGKTGLEIYERLAQELPAYLYPGAQVWLEIGYQQGMAMQTLWSVSHWKRWRLEKDWAGHDRFFFLENE